MTIDWGDVPTWVGAITTLGALIAAGMVLRVEMRRDRDAAEDRARSEQAMFCAAWPGLTARGGHVVFFRNGSQLPVYDVRITIRNEEGRVLEVGDTERIQPPGERTYGWPNEVFDVDELGDRIRDNREQWFPECSFTDAAGRVWFRDWKGTLLRATPSHLGAVRGP